MEEQLHDVQARSRLPNRKEVIRALGTFSALERLVFIAGLLLSAVMALVLLYKLNDRLMVSIPISGGTLTEGVVGTPRYVNPLLSATDADRDLTALVYRGLMKEDGTGNLVPDLAESYSISSNNLTYTFKIRDDAKFQDGSPVTADDVVFTVASALDSSLKSAERVKWQGVTAIAENPKTVSFTLKAPYAPFLLSTTLGIMPKHVWSVVPYEDWMYSEHNTKDVIGSGWYRIKKISTQGAGVPEYYELVRAGKGAAAPKIDKIVMRFYANEQSLVEAFESGDVDSIGGISPESATLLKDDARLLSTPLPRVFGIFFNQNEAKIFADANVRKAISLAIDKERIVNDVLHGFGTVTDGPIPASVHLADETKVLGGGDPAAARALLEKNGWKLGDDGIYMKPAFDKKSAAQRLSFELDTNDVEELRTAVGLIAEDLRAAGIEVDTKVYQTGSLNQDIIRPRKFQALFFGQVVSSQSDLFAFWHSSQRQDPGLNIAGYQSAAADKLLEQGLQQLDPEKESAIYNKFHSTFLGDMPAVFIYSPAYVYAVDKDLAGISLGQIIRPEDRFENENGWYLETEKVWEIFAQN